MADLHRGRKQRKKASVIFAGVLESQHDSGVGRVQHKEGGPNFCLCGRLSESMAKPLHDPEIVETRKKPKRKRLLERRLGAHTPIDSVQNKRRRQSNSAGSALGCQNKTWRSGGDPNRRGKVQTVKSPR